jgi:hypothetical protein
MFMTTLPDLVILTVTTLLDLIPSLQQLETSYLHSVIIVVIRLASAVEMILTQLIPQNASAVQPTQITETLNLVQEAPALKPVQPENSK